MGEMMVRAINVIVQSFLAKPAGMRRAFVSRSECGGSMDQSAVVQWTSRLKMNTRWLDAPRRAARLGVSLQFTQGIASRIRAAAAEVRT